MKLSKPQMTLLRELNDRNCSCMEYYTPAKKLVEIGFAEWKSSGRFGENRLLITAAGSDFLKGCGK